ncbi:branched-chain amino acid ABC transporter permease [Tianweitania sediminis]|uniref:Branched-chain amino acid ABC transporter permease n=1 Tax=Tianweitania sediminis TaxID=1502156 RepID=A0A8J7R4Z9_9HYPH|nr:branched-chain amino acid ABC transporter permease [Tianweitania sediminis]MBP0441343.1 branched-chain amino acid ABC transporter permease [Tianweitania sediminis]
MRVDYRMEYVFYGILLLAAVAFPFFATNEYQVYVMALAFIWAISAMGLNLIAGYTGQLNLAHAGFMAIGAYTVGLLTVDYGVPFWLAFLLAGPIAAVVGFFAGILSLRLKTHFFSIFTLCVGYIIYLLIEKGDSFTHGPVGVIGIPAPSIGPLVFDTTTSVYFLVLAFLVLTIWVMRRLVRSIVGRSFVAIRNSDDLAEALGINLMRTKVLAFTLSTFIAGLSGGLFAGFVRFLGPDLAREYHTFDLIAFVLVGGIGTLMGPVLGAVALTWVTQSLQFLENYRMIVFGPMLILLVMFFPHGIIGTFGIWMARRRANAGKRSNTQAVLPSRSGEEARANA